ncbi:MAG: hypothetical protein U9Q96_02260 [Patescibacteria group bacterium]|nr:hypothetical protein [Patescibacteria group bacterium]
MPNPEKFEIELEPKIETEEEKNKEKEILWDKKAQEIEEIRDREDQPIDEKIKEVIIALQLLDINTEGSCEGHDKKEGAAAPWVDVVASGQPKNRFIGQEEVFQRVAEKYNVLAEDLRENKDYEEWLNEAINEASDNGETEEYKEWREINEVLQDKTENILKEFYQFQDISMENRFVIIPIAEGGFRIVCGEKDYQLTEIDRKEMSEAEKKAFRKRLTQNQETMKKFGNFLKGRII